MAADPHVAETHISWVLLTGEAAYKVMKPVRTDVVDQGDVEARRSACEREVALNARLAPDVYRGVGAIVLDGDELEPVIVMRRMPESRRLTALLDGPGAREAVRDVARRMATFHAATTVLAGAAAEEVAGTDALRHRWRDDLRGVRDGTADARVLELAGALEQLATAYLDGRGPLFAERIRAGMVRDGHGDLLADDVFCLDDGPRILDCLAFDDSLRRVDVLADVAFLVMDLQRLGHGPLAEAFLHDYVALSGERHASSLAHLYVAQRALVRAKVAILRHGQDATAGRDATDLLELALDHLRRAEPRLVLVGGLPGAGKTTLSHGIGEEYGFVVVSSDEVRRDLGLRAADIGPSAYEPGPVEQVYDELLARSAQLLAHGASVVLDASWTRSGSRERARAVAADAAARVVEVRCTAPADVCRRRIADRARHAAGSEAVPTTVDVLGSRFEPWPEALTVDTSEPDRRQVVVLHRTWAWARDP